MNPALALSVSVAAALIARAAKGVSWDGALAGVLVGAVLLTSTGWAGAAILAAFFVPSTIVGRLTSKTTDEKSAEIRSATQVLANGGPAAVGSLTEFIVPGLGFGLATASLAAVSADTWATALGRSASRDPRLLAVGPRVAPGTSGGVSWRGTLGALAGAAAVAGAAAASSPDTRLFGATLAIGLGGMFLDSILGGLAQARFVCAGCGLPSESRRHCGRAARLEKGWRWLDNDTVNAVTATAAALAGAGVILL